MSAEESAIRTLLTTYGTALRTLDIDAAVALYTPDGVFMAPGHTAMAGTDNLRRAYERVFSTSTLDVEFDFKEIVVTSEEWAFARTTATGTKTMLVKGGSVDDAANQELFVLRKGEGGWRIARYAFSSMKPML